MVGSNCNKSERSKLREGSETIGFASSARLFSLPLVVANLCKAVLNYTPEILALENRFLKYVSMPLAQSFGKKMIQSGFADFHFCDLSWRNGGEVFSAAKNENN